MGFLKKLFGGDSPDKPLAAAAGDDGFFVYVQCDHCGAKVRLRIHKQHDLNNTAEGYIWHKTIVDNRCFRQIPTVATFDRSFNLINANIEGGRFISREEYERPEVSQPTDETEESQ